MRQAFYYWPQHTGRPRERWYVSDYSGAIVDANRLRRNALVTCEALDRPLALVVATEAGEQSIRIEITQHPIYGWRWWLICPLCRLRRVKLYALRRGCACRLCQGIGYSRRRAAVQTMPPSPLKKSRLDTCKQTKHRVE